MTLREVVVWTNGLRLIVRHYISDAHGFAAFAFAFVGGFHEGVDFDGFFRCNRSDARFEEFHDFTQEWGVVADELFV